jgi:IclR family transcriptional regulator, acetate operon repressor
MGSAFLRRRNLVERARSVMQELMETTGETANLGVAEDDCVVFVSQVETHQAIRAFFRPGTRSTFHASGIGKAILAHLPAERVGAILRKSGLEAFTLKTLADPQALSKDLGEIRERGWSVDDEERYPGMRCVAAAIFNEFGEPVGGVSVSGPTVRVTPERAAEFGPLVQKAAARITRMIGGKEEG